MSLAEQLSIFGPVSALTWVEIAVLYKHSGLKFVTPTQRHDGRDSTILQHRKEVYEAAKKRRPERWTGETRDWNLKNEVWLNPDRNQPEELQKAA
jgi:putative transposase